MKNLDLVRHETLIPKKLKAWVKSMKKKGIGSESLITTAALSELKSKLAKIKVNDKKR